MICRTAPPGNDGDGSAGMSLSTMSNIEARQPSRAETSMRTFREHVNMILVGRSHSGAGLPVQSAFLPDRRGVRAESRRRGGRRTAHRPVRSAPSACRSQGASAIPLPSASSAAAREANFVPRRDRRMRSSRRSRDPSAGRVDSDPIYRGPTPASPTRRAAPRYRNHPDGPRSNGGRIAGME